MWFEQQIQCQNSVVEAKVQNSSFKLNQFYLRTTKHIKINSTRLESISPRSKVESNTHKKTF